MTDQEALDRYNAIMGTPTGKKAYGTLSSYARAYQDELNHLQFMNLAISAAMERCGMAAYRGSILRAVLMSPSHHVDVKLDEFLLLFDRQ